MSEKETGIYEMPVGSLLNCWNLINEFANL